MTTSKTPTTSTPAPGCTEDPTPTLQTLREQLVALYPGYTLYVGADCWFHQHTGRPDARTTELTATLHDHGVLCSVSAGSVPALLGKLEQAYHDSQCRLPNDEPTIAVGDVEENAAGED
jgi:hypothetical protein